MKRKASYKPEAARFTTTDPIKDGSNWYVYVNNNPVNWKDLWGLWDELLERIIGEHTGKNAEEYHRGKNDCDIFVESILDEAGIP